MNKIIISTAGGALLGTLIIPGVVGLVIGAIIGMIVAT